MGGRQLDNQLAVFIDFENIAIWAGQQFFDLDITRLMEYLKSRAPVSIKRAYADWGRFPGYREEMINNSIDLIQMYTVRAGKNRADIRLAIDAFETTVTRPQVHTIVVVSGDSDFGALVSKLREYGRYVLGIGPREITHPSLIKACDEFVYLETIIGAVAEPMGANSTDQEEARRLLQRALLAHGQRGELPVLAAKLKQTMLSMDSTFNEANFGYGQFRSWLEDSGDLVKLFFKDLQLYVTPYDFVAPNEFELTHKEPTLRVVEASPYPGQTSPLGLQYIQIFKKVITYDLTTRRDVLRDIYRELSQRPGERSTGVLLDELRQRYESQGLARSKTMLQQIWQMGFRQRTYDYMNHQVSFQAPVRLADDIDSESTFIRRCESGFAYAIIRAGLEVNQEEMAAVLLNEREQIDTIQSLLDDLEQRGVVVHNGEQYNLPGRNSIPFRDDPNLQPVVRDIIEAHMPDELPRGPETARNLAKKALLERSQDFAASALAYLLACRLLWDAIEEQDPDARLEELRWFIASYASVKAGALSQTMHDYDGALSYYLAFFSMVQEEDPLWDRMRGLINPMLYYYWANLGRRMGAPLATLTRAPDRIAVELATHPNPELCARWQKSTRLLAQVNPGLLRRIADQIRLNLLDYPEGAEVAEQIERML